MIMRKYLLILLTILCLGSCSREGSGSMSDAVVDPISECVVPSNATGGEDVILQWNGFVQDDVIVLSGSSGEHIVRIQKVTGSGLIFYVSFAMEPGRYAVILRREADEQLGMMDISAPDIPFVGVSLPSSVIAGEDLLIAGSGYDRTVIVTFVSSEGERIRMESSLDSRGIVVRIPSVMPEGQYEVYISYMDCEWFVAAVSVSSAAKRLVSITYVGPYFGSTEVAYSWTVDEESSEIVLTESLVENGVFAENASDVYESDGPMSYKLTVDGLEMSNDVSMSYILDTDGKVTASDVILYGNDEPTRFEWSYDSDDRLSEVTFISNRGEGTFASLEYQDGNIVRFNSRFFEYSDPELKNNPYAPSVVWGYMAVQEKFDPFLYFPYLTGLYRTDSPLLPTSFKYNDGGGEVTCPLSYTFDDDGYVLEMSWVENRSTSRIMFATSL